MKKIVLAVAVVILLVFVVAVLTGDLVAAGYFPLSYALGAHGFAKQKKGDVVGGDSPSRSSESYDFYEEDRTLVSFELPPSS